MLKSRADKVVQMMVAVLVSIAVLLPSYKGYKKQLLPLYSAGLKHLPRKFRQNIRTTKLPKHLSLLVIKDGTCDTYSNFADDHWQNKLDSVRHTVNRIQQTTDPIPDGYYMLALEDGVHAEYAVPLLAFAGDQKLLVNNKVVLIPDFEAQVGHDQLLNTISNSVQNYPWDKKQAAIFWRGGANGLLRVQFMRDVAAKHAFLNAGFIGHGIAEDKKLHAYSKKHFALTAPVSAHDSMAYKYLLDIDGYSCSYSRMAWIMSSNSLLVKHTSDKRQWYYDKLQPYENYLPIKADFSDLQQQFEWAEANPDQVQQMIANAQKLAADIFTQPAIDAATRSAFKQYRALTQS